jgi:predicted TIM-barrel fold metal-dependent hydrolase
MPDYLAAAKGLSVVKSVHLEADVDEPYARGDRAPARACRSAGQSTRRHCGLRPAESKDFKSYLDRIAGHRRLREFAVCSIPKSDEVGQGESFINNVAALAGYGLSFDLCVLARQLPIAVKLISKCRDVVFILDHCGVPQVHEKNLDPWRSYIVEIARLSNVSCKISGLVAYADPQRWTVEDLRPFVERAIASFGWDRVLFGSDWPVCTPSASYQQWVGALRAITQEAGEVNQRKSFNDNDVRVCPGIPLELKPNLHLDCLGVLPHSGSELLARPHTSVQTNRKTRGENLDSMWQSPPSART